MTAPKWSSPDMSALADWLSYYATCICDDERCGRKMLEIVTHLRAGVAQAQSSDRITQAIRDYCISLGSPVQLSSDGVERIYYSGISIVGLADAILTNAAPANRSTAKATANVGDNGERMGSEPAMGIVTGGSDPTRSMMPSTDRCVCPNPDLCMEAGKCVEKAHALEPCEYCGNGKRTGLPGNACENCMNTGLKYPSASSKLRGGE